MTARIGLVFGIIMITILNVTYLVNAVQRNRPTSVLEQRQREIQQIPVTPPPAPDQKPPLLIQEINQRNALIQSYSCDDIEVKIWQKGLRFRLTGTIAYQKSPNFRMEIESRFGKELDLGSNDKVFWYWSRRDKQPGLYYAAYEDYQKTRLKTPFNPIFMRQSLGLEEIQVNNTKIVESDKDMVVTEQRFNSIGQPVLFAIFIDKENKRVSGVMITDMNNKPLASAEIQAYQDGLPSQILYMWYEEDKALQLILKSPRCNSQIPPERWALPSYTPTVNMAEELVRLER